MAVVTEWKPTNYCDSPGEQYFRKFPQNKKQGA